MWIVITSLIFSFYILPLFACRQMIKKDHLKTGCPITIEELLATIIPIANIVVCIMWWLSEMDRGSNFIYGFFGVKKNKNK